MLSRARPALLPCCTCRTIATSTPLLKATPRSVLRAERATSLSPAPRKREMQNSTTELVIAMKRSMNRKAKDHQAAHLTKSTPSSPPRRPHQSHTSPHPAPRPARPRHAPLPKTPAPEPERDAALSQPRNPPSWLVHRQTMKAHFPSGWAPPRRLSREATSLLRTLHASSPSTYTTPLLAERFKISPEAVRRVLRSKWELEPEEAERRERKRRDERERERRESGDPSWAGDVGGQRREMEKLRLEQDAREAGHRVSSRDERD